MKNFTNLKVDTNIFTKRLRILYYLSTRTLTDLVAEKLTTSTFPGGFLDEIGRVRRFFL